MDDWAKVTLGALVGAVGVAGAAFATGYFSLASKDDELRVHLVELAIGILRADPKEGITPARGWAIKVIENNSGVKFDDDDRAALLSKPIVGKDLGTKSLWLDKDMTVIPGGGDVTDFIRRWKEQMDQEPGLGAKNYVPPAASQRQ